MSTGPCTGPTGLQRGIATVSAVIVFTCVLTSAAAALPRFALSSGSSCASCHVNLSGGNQRTEGGWASMQRVALIRPSLFSMITDAESNTLFSERVSWGFDIRLQMAKRPEFDSQTRSVSFPRSFFFMQIAPSLAVRPVDGLELYGTVNLVKPELEAIGQQYAAAGASFRVVDEVTVQAGLLQPDVGIRHDDHTMFMRSRFLLPPMYTEPGAELHVEPLRWLTVSGGVYDAVHRRKAGITGSDSPMLTGRVSAMHSPGDMDLVFHAGASLMHLEDQQLVTGSLGVGIIDGGTLLVEYGRWDRPALVSGSQDVSVISVLASWPLVEGMDLTARYERASVDQGASGSSVTTQYVVGAQVFLFPSVELRPEYRWSDSPTLRLAQYTAQLHLYY